MDHSWRKTIIGVKSKLPPLLEHRPDPEDSPKTFKIRVASGMRRTQANLLIQKKFPFWEQAAIDLNSEENTNRTVLTLDINDTPVGTITLIIDSPLGLDADATYKVEVDHLRSPSRKLAEITNFAMDGTPNNKKLMASIIHLAYIFARRNNHCTDFIIEVKARHSRYYEKMLGFKRCGPEKLSSWTDGVSALLWLDLSHMEKQIGKLGGALPPTSGEKSLYPYFFSKEDENGIATRLNRG